MHLEEDEMKSDELNMMLIKKFPNLIDLYHKEVEWQEGDKTGSHIVYGDVFTPYIKECISNKSIKELRAIFEYIEFLLSKKDLYIDDVITFSVIECISCQFQENQSIIDMLGTRTKKCLMSFI
jgi:hypothetical protein